MNLPAYRAVQRQWNVRQRLEVDHSGVQACRHLERRARAPCEDLPGRLAIGAVDLKFLSVQLHPRS